MESLSGATNLGHSEPGSYGNERLLNTPQFILNCSLTIKCSLVSYSEHPFMDGGYSQCIQSNGWIRIDE